MNAKYKIVVGQRSNGVLVSLAIKAFKIIVDNKIDIEYFYKKIIIDKNDYSYYINEYHWFGQLSLTKFEFNIIKEAILLYEQNKG